MYKNPTPNLDDEYVSRHFGISMHFEDPMTAEDAAKNFENYVKTNGLPTEWVRLGKIRMLATPKQQNILKDKLLSPRLQGEWLPMGKTHHDYIHCKCSICGHTEEAIRTVKIGRSSDEYIGTIYKFCPKCGSSMAAGNEERLRVKRKLRMDTPHGRIEADLIPDDEFPAIAVTDIDEKGDEISYAILEYDGTKHRFQLRVYSHEDPNGDPMAVIPMSPVYGDAGKPEIDMDEVGIRIADLESILLNCADEHDKEELKDMERELERLRRIEDTHEKGGQKP